MTAPSARGSVVMMPRRQDPPEDDGVVIARIAGGNLAALGILHDRHSEAVRRFVLRATNRGADADDIVQETFLTLMRIATTTPLPPGGSPISRRLTPTTDAAKTRRSWAFSRCNIPERLRKRPPRRSATCRRTRPGIAAPRP